MYNSLDLKRILLALKTLKEVLERRDLLEILVKDNIDDLSDEDISTLIKNYDALINKTHLCKAMSDVETINFKVDIYSNNNDIDHNFNLN